MAERLVPREVRPAATTRGGGERVLGLPCYAVPHVSLGLAGGASYSPNHHLVPAGAQKLAPGLGRSDPGGPCEEGRGGLRCSCVSG